MAGSQASPRIERRSEFSTPLRRGNHKVDNPMNMNLTRRDIDKLQRMQRDAERDQARTETYTGQLIQSGEILGANLATGMLMGRFGAMSVGPIPIALLAGLGLHALGFTPMVGDYGDDLHNIADGVLGAYATTLGVGVGATMRASAGLPPLTASASFAGVGNLPGYANPNLMTPGGYASYAAYPGGMTPAEMDAMVAAMA